VITAVIATALLFGLWAMNQTNSRGDH